MASAVIVTDNDFHGDDDGVGVVDDNVDNDNDNCLFYNE